MGEFASEARECCTVGGDSAERAGKGGGAAAHTGRARGENKQERVFLPPPPPILQGNLPPPHFLFPIFPLLGGGEAKKGSLTQQTPSHMAVVN